MNVIRDSNINKQLDYLQYDMTYDNYFDVIFTLREFICCQGYQSYQSTGLITDETFPKNWKA